ncbi:hypothetical protein TH0950_11110 [Helicobacter pylori]
MKKSFKKLGFFSLTASSVLLGSMNATDLETYAALQKPSHVFGNYAEKDSGNSGTTHTTKNKTPDSSAPPTKKDETSGSGDKNQHTASSGTPSPSGSGVESQLVKDTTTVYNLKSVSVSGMNTTLSGVESMSQQSATIGTLLNSSADLSSVIPNAQGLSSAFSALESAQNTLKGYLDSSSTTIGQLTNGSNAVVGALDKAINQVDMGSSRS